MKSQFRSRWQSKDGDLFIRDLVWRGRSGNGLSISESPFGCTVGGLLDLRGISLPKKEIFRKVEFYKCDFSYCLLDDIRFENCSISSSIFFDASIAWSDSGNHFVEAIFEKGIFRNSFIGYKGSKYDKCRFIKPSFTKASFIRPEFDNCVFDNCELKRLDFGASSFESCIFNGTLDDVWFKGKFETEYFNQTFGIPRTNRMFQVSFENCKLKDLTFSEGVDLSTVIMPAKGTYFLFDRWHERLSKLISLADNWSPSEFRQVQIFHNTHLRNLQEWWLFNLDDLEQDFPEIINKVIKVLQDR